MNNTTKNKEKDPTVAILYKCEDCGKKVKGVVKYKDGKLLCERCYYSKKKNARFTRSINGLHNHYVKWVGI